MELDANLRAFLNLLHKGGGQILVLETELERTFAPFDTQRALKLGMVKRTGDATLGVYEGFALTKTGRKALASSPQ